jgi:hypothetical protein
MGNQPEIHPLHLAFRIGLLVAVFLITRDVLRDYALRTADELAGPYSTTRTNTWGSFFGEMEHLARGLAGTSAVRTADERAMGDLFMATVHAAEPISTRDLPGDGGGGDVRMGGRQGLHRQPSQLPSGYDPRVRPWYRTALLKNDFAISDPYTYASVEDTGITCVLP